MTNGRLAVAGLACATGLLGAGAAALGWGIARKLTAPITPRDFNLTVRSVERADGRLRLVLDRTPSTAAPGVYNLWFQHGGWAQLGTDVEDRGPTLVARSINGTSDDLMPAAGDQVAWSGIFYASPSDAGLAHRDVHIVTPAGHAPAWRIDGDPSMWAIHIHGLGSPRAGTLRGVQVATELGLTSLVVSFRNDGEGPRIGNGRSTLGAAEADDVDAAIGYAIRRGAERIVLFGWSMGAAIALQLAHRTAYRDLVAGLVLDSPVLDWRSVIQANCKRAGLPRSAGSLAMPWLTRETLARWVGLPSVLTLDDSDWVDKARGVEVPALILHGTRDDSVPISNSIRLRDQRPDLVTLEAFDAGHTLNWNSDPTRWNVIVRRFADSRVDLRRNEASYHWSGECDRNTFPPV